MANTKPKTYMYPAIFTYEEGEEITVTFPDLDVATSGEDDADALNSARELLGITLYGMEEDEESIPTTSRLSDIKLEANQTAALIDVYMPAIRMNGVNKSVNRTVTLPAWLNAAALEKGLNFSQVLQEALKDLI